MESFLLDQSFKKVDLELDEIFYKGKRIKKSVKKLFYHVNSIVQKLDNTKSGIVFSDKKKLYLFQDTLVFESTSPQSQGIKKAIALKAKKKNVKGEYKYTFEKNIAELFDKDKEGYKEIAYNVKLMEHQPPLNNEYTILYNEEVEEARKYNQQYTVENIYKKYHLDINNIAISIFIQDTNLSGFTLNDNTILMTDPSTEEVKFKCNYLKVLYRLRNSIAHGEFKILDNEILFCNTHGSKINLRAKIKKSDIYTFLEELKENTLDKQLI